MSDFKATFDQARKRLRHKLGLPAAVPPNVEPSAASSDGSSSGVSVLHRVMAFEDHKPAPDSCDPLDSDIIPLPAALSHSLSGTWKQRIDDKGKPVWQRDAREAASNEQSRGPKCERKLIFQSLKELAPAPKQTLQEPDTIRQQTGSGILAEQLTAADGQILLQLPQVQSLQQAKEQSDALQLQAYKKTRKLQEAKFLARQAAERLLAFQMQQSEAELDQGDDRKPDASHAAMQDHVQGLQAAQAHMFELSQQVSIAELATELAEARAQFIELNSGNQGAATLHTTAAASGSPKHGNLESPFASQKASSAGSSCGSLSSKHEPSSNLARVKTDMPSQVARLRRLSSSLNYPELPFTPQSEPVTPMGDTRGLSVFAPDTPSCFTASVVGESSAQSSGGNNSAACDTSAESHVHPDEPTESVDSESTLDRLQAITECAAAQGEVASSVLPPLPDVPNSADCADGVESGRGSMRYVYIGCAAACLVALALWARDASAASFSTRLFPT